MERRCRRNTCLVSLQITSHTFAYNAEPVDRCILCQGRGIARSIRPDYCAKPAGYFKFLSRQQLSTQPNGSQPSIPSSFSNPTKPYTPPSMSVLVNGLWFLSLAMSLTCALLATLVQRWARRYLRNAYRRYNPHQQHVFVNFISSESRSCIFHG